MQSRPLHSYEVMAMSRFEQIPAVRVPSQSAQSCAMTQTNPFERIQAERAQTQFLQSCEETVPSQREQTQAQIQPILCARSFVKTRKN